jgi:hypothetical protein
LEEGSVDHDPAIDRYSNRLIILHEKGRSMVVAMVGASQGHELSTALDKVSPNPLFVPMILQRKSFKSVNALRPKEFGKLNLD